MQPNRTRGRKNSQATSRTGAAPEGENCHVMHAPPDYRRAVVVVPVHNEEQLLDTSLSAVIDAAEHAGVPTEVVVVLDACSDASVDIADAWAHKTVRAHETAWAHSPRRTVLPIARRSVGAARAAGFLAAECTSETWFATTDADSTVRVDWLSSQLAHARRGAHVVAGTVVADLGNNAVASAYRSGYRNRFGHRHVHGANLGMSADAYWSVGGFRALDTGEDVDLVGRFERADVPVLFACDSPVFTSCRRIGRAPDGFAAHLAELDSAVLDSAVFDQAVT